MQEWMKVNPIGVVVSACAYIVAGVIFYSHWALGKLWMPLVKHMQKQAEKRSILVYLGAFISALLIAYIMGCVNNLARTKEPKEGAFLGFLIWIGFVIPTIFSPVLFGKKAVGMFWLDAIFYLIVYAVIGAIMAKFNLLTKSK